MAITRKYFKAEPLSPPMGTPRRTTRPPSLGTTDGVATLKPVQMYTGTEMIGIAIIHKSCLQPVFSKEAATETAQMRR